MLIDLSGASPGTASFYRCLLALPLLLPLAAAEHRDQGRPPRRRWLQPLAAGALFAGDILLWTRAIGEVGAGLSTVLVNVQVVIVPLLALAIDREPLPRRFLACLPFLLLGVVLTERPSLTQLAGCLLILASGYVATLHPRRAREDTRKRSRV